LDHAQGLNIDLNLNTELNVKHPHQICQQDKPFPDLESM
jgi:hypothetical protein